MDNLDRKIRHQLLQNFVGFSSSDGFTSRASAKRTNSRSVTHRTWDSTSASVSRTRFCPVLSFTYSSLRNFQNRLAWSASTKWDCLVPVPVKTDPESVHWIRSVEYWSW